MLSRLNAAANSPPNCSCKTDEAAWHFHALCERRQDKIPHTHTHTDTWSPLTLKQTSRKVGKSAAFCSPICPKRVGATRRPRGSGWPGTRGFEIIDFRCIVVRRQTTARQCRTVTPPDSGIGLGADGADGGVVDDKHPGSGGVRAGDNAEAVGFMLQASPSNARMCDAILAKHFRQTHIHTPTLKMHILPVFGF